MVKGYKESILKFALSIKDYFTDFDQVSKLMGIDTVNLNQTIDPDVNQIVKNYVPLKNDVTEIDEDKNLADPVNYKGQSSYTNNPTFKNYKNAVEEWLNKHQKGKEFLASGTEYAKIFTEARNNQKPLILDAYKKWYEDQLQRKKDLDDAENIGLVKGYKQSLLKTALFMKNASKNFDLIMFVMGLGTKEVKLFENEIDFKKVNDLNEETLSLKINGWESLNYRSLSGVKITGSLESKNVSLMADKISNEGKIVASESSKIKSDFLNNEGGQADLVSLKLEQVTPKDTFVNHGQLRLKKLISLGSEKPNLENSGKLEIVGSGHDFSYKKNRKLEAGKGFVFGKILNHEKATIGFGDGTYVTDIFTNYGIEVVLKGQDMHSKDIFNYGEMHCKSDFRIDCKKSIFSKIGKIFVDGKLRIEVGEKVNAFDLLKNSSIESSKPVEIRCNDFHSVKPLDLKGAWVFDCRNLFKVSSHLEAESLFIKSLKFETSDQPNSFGEIFSTKDFLNIRSISLSNWFGNLFGRDGVLIYIDEDLINGCKVEGIKNPEGLWEKNGSSISSKGGIEITSLKGSIYNDYGTIWSKGDLTLKASNTFRNKAGWLISDRNCAIVAKKALITREDERVWFTDNCGGHHYSRACGTKTVFRYCDDCGKTRRSEETSAEAIVNICGNEVDGLGNLELICDDVEVIASIIATTGNIYYGSLKNLFNGEQGLLGNFAIKARNDKNAQVKSKGAVKIDAGSINLQGSLGAKFLNIDTKQMLVEFLGVSSKDIKGDVVGENFVIDLSLLTQQLSSRHGLIRDNQIALANQPRHSLSTPMGSNYTGLQRVFYEKVPQGEMVFETGDDVGELMLKAIVASMFKQASLASNLFFKMHTDNMGKVVVTLNDLQERAESFIYYKLAQASNQNVQLSPQKLHTMLFLARDDLDKLESGHLSAEEKADIKVKHKLQVLSGVIEAKDLLVAAENVEVATKVITVKNGAGYYEYFSKLATLEGKDRLNLEVEDLFYHKGGCFKSGLEGGNYTFRKEIGEAAIARRLDVFGERRKGRTITTQNYSESSLVSNFISQGDLNRKGEESIYNVGTIDYAKKKVNLIAPKIDKKDVVLNFWSKTEISGKKGFLGFGGTPRISYGQSQNGCIKTNITADEKLTWGSDANDAKIKVEGGVINTPLMEIQGDSTVVEFKPSVGQNESYFRSEGRNPFGSNSFGNSQSSDVLSDTILNVNEIKGAKGAKGYFVNCKLDGIKMNLDYEQAVQHVTTRSTGFGNSKGNGWNKFSQAVGIIAALGVQFATVGTMTPVLASGVSYLTNVASTSFLNNGGDLRAVCDDLTSRSSLQNLIITVASAGITDAIADKFQIGNSLQTKTYQDFVSQTAKMETIKGLVNTGLNMGIRGDAFDDALQNAGKSGLVNVLAASGAKGIGNFYGTGNLDYLAHKFLHGFNGAIAGMILDGKDGAIAGAIGAITAEVMMDDVRSNPVTRFEDKAIEAVNQESKRLKRPLSEIEVDKLTKDLIKDDLLKSKISSVIVASIFNQDPNIALLTGTNALDNNCWHLLLPAVTGALRISAIYEYYNIWKNEGEEGLLKHLALNKMIGVVSSKSLGIAWKIGNSTFTSAKLALQAFLNNNPIIAKRLYKFSEPVVQGVGNAKSQIGSFFNKSWSEGVEKVKFTKFKVGKSTEAENLLNKTSKPTPMIKDAEGMSVLEKTEVHVLYVKPHKDPKVPVYVGRTRGKVKDTKNFTELKRIVEKRDRNHHMNAKGHGKAELLKHSNDPDVIRGLEQIKIDDLGGALSQGGSSSNAINSIAKNNPKLQQYLEAAKRAITHE